MTGIYEMIAVMKHFDEGGEVESANKGFENWSLAPKPAWNWQDCKYRIKPKAKRKIKLEAWLDSNSELRYFKPYAAMTERDWTRLPLLDLETEIEN